MGFTLILVEKINRETSVNILHFCNSLSMTLDELLEFKKQQYFHIIINEKERDTLYSMIETCKRDAQHSPLYERLDELEHYIKAFFNRAQSQ